MVLGSCAAKHKKVLVFSEHGEEDTAFLEIFLQCCPISIPDSVISIHPCVQKHMGEEEGPSLAAPSQALAAPVLEEEDALRACQALAACKNSTQKKTIRTLKYFFHFYLSL